MTTAILKDVAMRAAPLRSMPRDVPRTPWDTFIGRPVKLVCMDGQEFTGEVCDFDCGVLFLATAPKGSRYLNRFVAVPAHNIATLEKQDDKEK